MLTEIRLKNWKSYTEATLFIDSLSVLIGTNAGGKSNALDALTFLNRISQGSVITNALQGDGTQSPIRGGIDWAPQHPHTSFTIGATVRSDETTDYVYQISCEVYDNRCELSSEELIRVKYRPKKNKGRGKEAGRIKLFRTDACTTTQPDITARLYNEKQGAPRQSGRSTAVIFQLLGQRNRTEINEGVQTTLDAFRGVFILDPIPSHMRNFTPLSETLEPDAGNIAGVLAAFSTTKLELFDIMIAKFIRHLPEKEIRRVYAERVGKFQTDAMLYCEEGWGSKGNEFPVVDARGLSDGTLRFLAILTALLARPRGTLLVIEEVDNGLHPSRSSLLIKMLKEVGKEREIDVLVTTHNPALLDEMGSIMVPFITVAHRNQSNGNSELTLLESIHQLPKLLSMGTIGKLTSHGLIEKAIKNKPLQLKMDF